jgi:acyl-CoA synthetase (AMP-forming)/AMP-acid ligase II
VGDVEAREARYQPFRRQHGRAQVCHQYAETPTALANAFTDTDLESAQIGLNACPMVHGTGLFTFLLSASCGTLMVMVERFDPDAVLDVADRAAILVAHGVGAQIYAR